MEPLLKQISAIIPDEKIDHELSFPQPDRGPHSPLKPSQMYRIHLLLCLKRRASFRQLQHDLLHHKSWRSFAHLKNKRQVPTLRALSEFRLIRGFVGSGLAFCIITLFFKISP